MLWKQIKVTISKARKFVMKKIKFIIGNIFTTTCQTLVNTVNCVGVMGAGIALEFRYRYPDMFEKYKELCEKKEMKIGKLWIYNVPNKNTKVLNFPTKNHWKYPSKIEYLEKGLQKFVDTYKERKITSIAFPLLGAQNGGIEPEVSKAIMEKYLSQCDIDVEIYEYDESSKDDLIEKFNDSFKYYDLGELEKLFKLNSSELLEIKNLISEHKLSNLFQLTQNKIKRIGEKNIQGLYNFFMNYELKSKPETLFSTDYVSEKLINNADYKVKRANIKN